MGQGGNIQNTNTPRYPELTTGITMDELVKKWSELVRALNDRDRQPILPSQVYGRTIEVGGNNFQDLTLAGTNVSVSGLSGLWIVYEYQIPRDAGFIIVDAVSVSSAAQVQIRTFLPLASSVRDRAISIVGTNTDGATLAAFNLGVSPTVGSSDVIVDVLGNTVTVETTVAISLNIGVTVTGNIREASTGFPINPPQQIVAFNPPSSLYQTMAYDGVATLTPLQTGVACETTISGSIATSSHSVAAYNPLNYTFKAYGTKWLRVA